ncbi:ATP-dependent helicase [Citromicrobium bathyomarinum]
MTFVKPEDWVPQGVAELEDRAWEALRETERSVSVTAGAGAGKTEFLAQKASYLLQTALCPAPKRILAISFKRDAAETLAKRVKIRCAEDQSRRFVSMTFDAFTKGLVDQFRLAIPQPLRPPADYEISFPTAQIVRDFLERGEFNEINNATFEKMLSARRILDDNQIVTARQREILDAYWQEQYYGGASPYLTFPMINRLAEHLVRTNARIRRALRITFPVIFLDEFQDVTGPQFELVTTAFDPATAVLTAVGDDKQRIMGWAGALPNAFSVFKQFYNARPISLLLNWRSHADLVAIQHVIASRIDPDVEPAQARAEREVDGAVSAIWQFEDRDIEIATLALWVKAQVGAGIAQPHDIAILVRNLANAAEDEMCDAFREQGLILRNLARNVGEISIQDLLSENLTEILMPFLRLGAEKKNPNAWSEAQETLRRLRAPLEDDEIALQLIAEDAADIAKAMRGHLAQHPAETGSAQASVDLLIELIDEKSIRQSTPSYLRDADFGRVKEGFVELLDEALSDAAGWSEALDAFEGLDQVPLMTVHKSKGMEFHTMIFFGLDSQSWWSLTPNRAEELNSFFVAFTRAKQRAFFTSCSERGGQIVWLRQLLGDAVPSVDGSMLA